MVYQAPESKLVSDKSKDEPGLFTRYSATLSWLLPIITSTLGASLISLALENPLLVMGAGLLMLLGYAASIFFGILGFVLFRKTRAKSVLIQAIIGTIFSALLIFIFLASAISSFMHY
jgi:hypothetical protein